MPLNESEKKLMSARSFTLEGIQFEDTIDLGLTNPKPAAATRSVEKERPLESSVKVVNLTSHLDDGAFNEERRSSNSSSITVMNKGSFKTIEFTVNLNKQIEEEEKRRQEMMSKMLGGQDSRFQGGFYESSFDDENVFWDKWARF